MFFLQLCAKYCQLVKCPATTCQFSTLVQYRVCELLDIKACPFGNLTSFAEEDGAFFCHAENCVFQADACRGVAVSGMISQVKVK